VIHFGTGFSRLGEKMKKHFTFAMFMLMFFNLNFALSQTFTDITESAGVLGLQKFGAHGIYFADITEDGFPDLLITNINGREIKPNLLFINQKDGTFLEDGKKRNAWNINLIDNKDKGWFGRGTHGSVFADLDNDGDYDLLNATTDIRICFHCNEGNGFFRDVTDSTGITSEFIATRGVTAFDADGDGDLDIFGNNGWQGVEEGNVQKNEFYINEGNFTFRQVDQGLAGPFGGQGVTDIDLDLDGDVDILCGRLDYFLENDGKAHFNKRPFGHGHKAGAGWMAGDFDNDGDFDLACVEDIVFRKDYEILFYRQEDDGTFQLTQRVPADKGGAMGSFSDLDNDGDIDFYASGDNKIYLNDGRGHFTALEKCGMDAERDDPRGVSMADIDNDGDLDIMVACKRSFCIMYRNDNNKDNNWLKVSVTSPSGTAGGFGAIVRIYQAGKAGQPEHFLGMRAISGNQGYLGQPDPVVHFGLKDEKLVDVEVTFVGGEKIIKKNQKVNKVVFVK
jgi:hypothetical protein